MISLRTVPLDQTRTTNFCLIPPSPHHTQHHPLAPPKRKKKILDCRYHRYQPFISFLILSFCQSVYSFKFTCCSLSFPITSPCSSFYLLKFFSLPEVNVYASTFKIIKGNFSKFSPSLNNPQSSEFKTLANKVRDEVRTNSEPVAFLDSSPFLAISFPEPANFVRRIFDEYEGSRRTY